MRDRIRIVKRIVVYNNLFWQKGYLHIEEKQSQHAALWIIRHIGVWALATQI